MCVEKLKYLNVKLYLLIKESLSNKVKDAIICTVINTASNLDAPFVMVFESFYCFVYFLFVCFLLNFLYDRSIIELDKFLSIILQSIRIVNKTNSVLVSTLDVPAFER